MTDPRIPEGLPVRRPGDPPLTGQHVVLHDDGTVQLVMGGPNAVKRRRQLRYGWALAILAGGAVAATNGWSSLGRYTIFAALLLGGAVLVSRYRKRRRVED